MFTTRLRDGTLFYPIGVAPAQVPRVRGDVPAGCPVHQAPTRRRTSPVSHWVAADLQVAGPYLPNQHRPIQIYRGRANLDFLPRGGVLEIRRTPTVTGFCSASTATARPHLLFPELPLEQFQADFEKFLLGTGWTFLAFSPERRTGRERRNFSRLLTDRRRWWTDGVRTPLEREQEERQRRLRRLRGASPEPAPLPQTLSAALLPRGCAVRHCALGFRLWAWSGASACEQ